MQMIFFYISSLFDIVKSNLILSGVFYTLVSVSALSILTCLTEITAIHSSEKWAQSQELNGSQVVICDTQYILKR